MTSNKQSTINPEDLLPRDTEMEELINKNRDPSEIAEDDAILKVVRDQRLASLDGERTKEFDILVKRLEFHWLSPFQKVVRSIYIVIGVGLGLLLLLAIIH